jgi:hypothetical protein
MRQIMHMLMVASAVVVLQPTSSSLCLDNTIGMSAELINMTTTNFHPTVTDNGK